MRTDGRITDVPGIGKKSAAELGTVGIHTLRDMVLFPPRAYDDRREERNLSDTTPDNPSIACRITVISHSQFPSKRSGMTLKATCVDDDGRRIELLCFNRPFMKDMLKLGSSWYITASAVERNRNGVYSTASFELKRTKEEAGIGRILPVYPLTGSITEKMMRNASSYALDVLSPFEDELPYDIYRRYSLMHHDDAYRCIHYPSDDTDIKEARRTLAFTELMLMELSILRGREHGKKVPGKVSKLEEKLISSLPFQLTADQLEAASEIRADLDSNRPMNRLLQGDVGSGKTLVAWLAALHEIAKGNQVAFMAPTELLARQHAEGAAELLSSAGIRIAFLTGSVKGQSRRLLLESLREGTTDLVVGTHALFSEDVAFRCLKLVIIDEQHRFGVQQREALKAKGLDASILSMTATPIPRTLALTLFADLDVSTLHTMPSGRIPVRTYLVSDRNRENMYQSIAVEFQRGHQAYFVYPRIDDEGESDLRDVTHMHEELQAKYPGIPSALIHSKLPEEDKIRILHDFRAKKIMYLVATSVVEVGIDIPDATCMVIEHADIFGLAALHQLRGRVGRSTLPSYCFLVFGDRLSAEAKARLSVMKETNDGFRIAEKDLEIRGPGEMAGDRQSGFLRLRFASLTSDLDLIEDARKEAERIAEEDPGLLRIENAPLRIALSKQE